MMTYEVVVVFCTADVCVCGGGEYKVVALQHFMVSCTTGMQGKVLSFTISHMFGHFFFGLPGGVAVTGQHASAVMALLLPVCVCLCAQQQAASCLCWCGWCGRCCRVYGGPTM